MDAQNYEQFHLTRETLGDAAQYLTPNLKLMVETYDERPIGVALPKTVPLKVVQTTRS